MNRTRSKYFKTAITICGYSAIFVLGVLAGGYIGAYALHSKQITADFEDPDYERASLERALESKDESVRARALNEHLEFLNRAAGGNHEDFPTYVAADKALTLARLSAISQRLGDDRHSALYLQKATSYCPEMKWRHCDGSELRAGAARLDRGAVDEIFSKKR